MRSLPLDNAVNRTTLLAQVDPYYQWPDANQFAKGAFDQVWPTALTFLTACAGISLVVYAIKSFSNR